MDDQKPSIGRMQPNHHNGRPILLPQVVSSGPVLRFGPPPNMPMVHNNGMPYPGTPLSMQSAVLQQNYPNMHRTPYQGEMSVSTLYQSAQMESNTIPVILPSTISQPQILQSNDVYGHQRVMYPVVPQMQDVYGRQRVMYPVVPQMQICPQTNLMPVQSVAGNPMQNPMQPNLTTHMHQTPVSNQQILQQQSINDIRHETLTLYPHPVAQFSYHSPHSNNAQPPPRMSGQQLMIISPHLPHGPLQVNQMPLNWAPSINSKVTVNQDEYWRNTLQGLQPSSNSQPVVGQGHKSSVDVCNAWNRAEEFNTNDDTNEDDDNKDRDGGRKHKKAGEKRESIAKNDSDSSLKAYGTSTLLASDQKQNERLITLDELRVHFKGQTIEESSEAGESENIGINQLISEFLERADMFYGAFEKIIKELRKGTFEQKKKFYEVIRQSGNHPINQIYHKFLNLALEDMCEIDLAPTTANISPRNNRRDCCKEVQMNVIKQLKALKKAPSLFTSFYEIIEYPQEEKTKDDSNVKQARMEEEEKDQLLLMLAIEGLEDKLNSKSCFSMLNKGRSGTSLMKGKLGDNEVVLRVIPRKYSERSNREVHALQISKNSKNILRMLFHVSSTKASYIIYEFHERKLSNMDLKSMSTYTRRRFSVQLIDIMYQLFQIKLVHCEISPSNVLVRDDGQLILCNLRRAHVDSFKAKKQMKISFQWGAPEVRNQVDQMHNHASDIYSAGLLLSYLIVGESFPQDPISFKIDDISAKLKDHSSSTSHIIGHMINSNPRLRPNGYDLKHFPYLWDNSTFLRFFKALDAFLWKNPDLEVYFPCGTDYYDWCSLIEEDVFSEMTVTVTSVSNKEQVEPQYTTTVRSFVRFFRNLIEHFNGKKSAKSIMNNKSGIRHYIERKFPGFYHHFFDMCYLKFDYEFWESLSVKL